MTVASDDGDRQTENVWIPDSEETFVKAELLDIEFQQNKLKNIEEKFGIVKLLNSNETKTVPFDEIHPMNPSNFDKIDNMSELTHLNEPSVLNNLENRYNDDVIYTYSGLFLVAINPYSNIKIYNQEYIKLYHGSLKEDVPPHIFAIAEETYQNLLSEKIDQTILVTGESGAGKTENTKKILQYLAAITTNDETIASGAISSSKSESFEMKILQSNPILESFGNSQTIRNNNSSRFGKFIKIEFDERGKINGAHIEWYLLEKSRVINQHRDERNYHIFYQFLNGVSKSDLSKKFKIHSNSVSNFKYLSSSNSSIPGISDEANFKELLAAFNTVGFSENEVDGILKVISIILHIGNLEFTSEKSEQATFKNDTQELADLLGVPQRDFQESILRPKTKAGREWVSQSKNSVQARFILNSLSRTLYERLFGYIVEKINKSLDHGSMTANYIGLLDIAGFEIFKHNSFEQLCINHTNEKLQQFFNHHMFVLEQNEYVKENIQWEYIDYGKDLQSTIDLIEKKSAPSGILPLLDEESILPKSSDESFMQKLLTSWDNKSERFKRSKLQNSFILKHYAGDVEYNIEGWLSKNKDPLNENLLTVLSKSGDHLVAKFFQSDESPVEEDSTSTSRNGRVKGKMFRTASSRHREQQICLLNQLSISHPHFVRCIIPNNAKMAKNFDSKLILGQLRCNGVLEGIRIAREGYPNRIFFKEFVQTYGMLVPDEEEFIMAKNNSRKSAELILSFLHLDPSKYKIGNTKLFFKAGVLATLENQKQKKMIQMTRILNAKIRGNMVRAYTSVKLKNISSARVLGETFRIYNRLMDDPWFNLFTRIKPLLSSTQDITKTRKFNQQLKTAETKLKEIEEQKQALAFENTHISEELKNAQKTLEIEKRTLYEKNDKIIKQLQDVQGLLKSETEKLSLNETLLEETKSKKAQLEKELATVVESNDKFERERDELRESYEKSKGYVVSLTDSLQTKEQEIQTLNSTKETLEKEIIQLKLSMDGTKKSHTELFEQKSELTDKITTLESKLLSRESLIENKEKEIKSLRDQLSSNSNADKDLAIKLITLEKNCTAAMTRLQTLVDENVDLRSQIDSLKKEQLNVTRQLKQKQTELDRQKQKIATFKSEIELISQQRDSLVTEHDDTNTKLRDARKKIAGLEVQIKSLENENEQLKQLQLSKASTNNSNDEINKLKEKLAQEISLNAYLNKRWDANIERPTTSVVDRNMDMEDMLRSYNEMKMDLNNTQKKLEIEIEEKKDLISKLRFTETRLASSSFDFQTAKGQLKKMKEIIENSNINVHLDEELNNIQEPENNSEKLLLEVQYLKRQLEVEKKAHSDAENVATALHDKFNKIQRVNSASDIYKLKFEASEERIRTLENKLNATPLKDRTNVPTGPDIFKNRGSVSKYEDEIRFQKLENYKLQEHLNETTKAIDALQYEKRQLHSKETLLNEQIDRIEHDLNNSERQKEMLTNTLKQQKQQYDECMKDLHDNEIQLRDYVHALSQAEDDVKNMASMIEKLKLQKKQNEKIIWERETERNDTEMKLQEALLELKRVRDVNNMLNSDLSHLKERLAADIDTSSYENEIDTLKKEIETSLKNETSLKKEISTLKYQLESLTNDSDAKVTDLLKQTQHYSNLAEVLGQERDAADAAEKELSKEYDQLVIKAQGLDSKVNSLKMENSQLVGEVDRLKSQLDAVSEQFSNSVKENKDITDNLKYLQETLELQRSQNERNEQLVQSLQSEVSEFREKYDSEKQKNIDLYEENQTLDRVTKQLDDKVAQLQSRLSDNTEKDAWLKKIHELETMVTNETELKYEEMKKTKNYERIINELQDKNERQAAMIQMANEDKQQFDEGVLQYNDQIGQLEKLISKQEIDLKRFVRDNSYFQDRVLELEKELAFWRERGSSIKDIGKRSSMEVRGEEVFS